MGLFAGTLVFEHGACAMPIAFWFSGVNSIPLEEVCRSITWFNASLLS